MRALAKNLDDSPCALQLGNHQRIIDAIHMRNPHVAEQVVVHVINLFLGIGLESMGPLAQKLRNTKVDIAVSLLRLHTIRRAEFLSVFLIFNYIACVRSGPNASEALCATEARGVDSTHQWKRKSRSCIFCVPATEAIFWKLLKSGGDHGVLRQNSKCV